MLLQKFLEEFADALEPALDPGRASGAIPRLRVTYDPMRKTSAAGEVLIGVGLWDSEKEPVEHAGVCLNNKGTARRFGCRHDYVTVTDLVLTPPPE
jgi:hypothetical protein